MIANFGFGVLVISFLVTLYSVFAAIYGERRKIPAMVESARRAMLLTWPLLTLTAGVLIYLLVNNHFEVQFVYEVTSRSMPAYLKVTAWWGGQAGSLLFWSWLMSAFATAGTLRKWERELGFLSFVIPYAFAMAALITGRTDDRWIRLTRRWSLWAWLFLSFGLVLGGRWAYDVLGWGGYWGWDPVEIAAFMPWLTGTAFLHSVMIQEKRGLLKHWNMILVILTYALVIFGTFLTRSGVLSSVHAFAQSAIGPLFFGFIGLTLITSVALIIYRWDRLKSEAQMDSLLSREAAFLLNNFLFIGIAFATLWGTIFPLVSELVTNQKVTVGAVFYERATGPLFAGLLFLMGVAPLAAWRHSTARTLGRAMWKPFAASLVVLAIVIAGGIRQPGALLGFWL